MLFSHSISYILDDPTMSDMNVGQFWGHSFFSISKLGLILRQTRIHHLLLFYPIIVLRFLG